VQGQASFLNVTTCEVKSNVIIIQAVVCCVREETTHCTLCISVCHANRSNIRKLKDLFNCIFLKFRSQKSEIMCY
jgi:hypothetical protein